jgi:hypothetical protein
MPDPAAADALEILTPRWYPLKSHPEQIRLINSTARFKIVPAGRRSGKTERAKRNLIIQALRESSEGRWLDYRYFAAAPTRDQARAIWWSDLKALIPRDLMDGPPRESDLTIRLITGAEIVVVGLDKPARMEGRSWNGGVIDEIANVKPNAWQENIRPGLADRKGWCWLIGVPEGRGLYFDWYQYAKSGVDPEWQSFTWVSADILDPAEIASARRTLDPLTFKQEMEGSFVTFEGRVYYPFERETHTADLFSRYNPGAPLLIALDFNVEPGVAAICQTMKLPARDGNGEVDGLGIIGEVHIPRNSSTPAVCRKIIADWGRHHGAVRLYGDATGGNRGSAKVAGSDWDLVRSELNPVFGSRLDFRVPRSNPLERSRVNAVNSMLRNTDGVIRLMVDVNRCPHVIKDFDGVRLLKGGSGEIDKKADPHLSHLTDGIGYLVFREFPIVSRVMVEGRVALG